MRTLTKKRRKSNKKMNKRERFLDPTHKPMHEGKVKLGKLKKEVD